MKSTPNAQYQALYSSTLGSNWWENNIFLFKVGNMVSYGSPKWCAQVFDGFEKKNVKSKSNQIKQDRIFLIRNNTV